MLSHTRSIRRLVWIRRPLLVAAATVVAGATSHLSASDLSAQTTATPAPQAASTAPPERTNPKRSDLELAAGNFERLARTEKDGNRRAQYLANASIIRSRLAQGDFQAGHRVLLFVAGDSALSDTFTVRSDQKLLLPNLPEISLAGVLDSELQGYLQTKLAQYIRNPSVRVQALLRVSVSGDVASPGFYSIPTDTPVSDVIMTAGGPSTSADMNKTVLRRGSTVVVKREGIQEAFRSERTMSDIGARPGDELFVPTKPTGSNWQKFAAIAASVTGIVWSVVWITGRN
jgi:protein involved in polysaccharide export with SLBB domain